MLFEFSFAKNYLFPKKGRFSSSLIALMSVGVISLIVWLILVFLSVTDGMEKAWLKKLTSFNSPIQITPTEAYYQSYYYQIDSISNLSDFNYKSIEEKASAPLTDPYDPEEDVEIPPYWPEREVQSNGTAKDLVKEAFGLIQNETPRLIAQAHEVSGALLNIEMKRPNEGGLIQETPHQSYLTQALYISSFSEKNPHLQTLIEPPRLEDLNHLFYLASQAVSPEQLREQIEPLLKNITIKRIKKRGGNLSCLLPLLPEGKPLEVLAYQKDGAISHLLLSEKGKGQSPLFERGSLEKRGGLLIFTSLEGKESELGFSIPLFSEEEISISATLVPYNLEEIYTLSDFKFAISCSLKGQEIRGTIPYSGAELELVDIKTFFEKEPSIAPPWPHVIKGSSLLPKLKSGHAPILLPKQFQMKQVKIGDRGYFSYQGLTPSTVQEQRLNVQVVGFYDTGVLPIGGLMVLTGQEIVHTINTSSKNYVVDQESMNRIQVWLPDISKTKEVHAKLMEAFDQAGLLPYWKLTPYYEYDFARDLFEQFQSDKYLFTFIGIIILIVACCNIISLLMILVNDKKKEIAILTAMGASKKSIGLIFTLCGGVLGCLSTLIGTLAAFFTLRNIDSVVHFLSFFHGQEIFNALFYGKSLPGQLSDRALIFTFIATPVISLLAGLAPALKACKFHPSQMLRSE